MAEGPYSRRLTVVATPAVTVAAAPQTLTSVPKSGYGENRGGGMMTGTGGDDGVKTFFRRTTPGILTPILRRILSRAMAKNTKPKV